MIRNIRIVITLLLAVLSILSEFDNSDVAFEFVFKIPLVLFITLLFTEFIVDCFRYKKLKRVEIFIPFLLLSIPLLFISIHWFSKTDFYLGKTRYIAVTPVGAADVYNIEFKGDNNIVLNKFDMLGTYSFYGTYERNNKNLLFNVRPDFRFSKRATISNDTINFVNDTTYLLIENKNND